MTTKELREQRAKLVADARELLDSVTDETSEADAKAIEKRFDDMMAQADKLKERIDREERAEQAEREVAERLEQAAEERGTSAEQEHDRQELEGRAFNAWLREGMGGINALSNEERQILMEMRAQGVSGGTPTGAAGGFLVPEGFYNVLTEAMLAFGGMRSASTVISTSSGNDMPMPTVDDTGNKGAILAENTQIAEQDVTFSSKTLYAYKYTSKLVRVSVELLQDSAFDINSYLARALGERIGRITNEHFTTGDGSSKPVGLLAASGGAASAGNSATAGAIGYDDLVDLEHAIDPAYRAQGAFMMHDSTLKTIKKLKDTEGRPLWMAGVAVGEPDTILGYRYVINQDMPQLDASSPIARAKALTFGDHRSYFIRDVLGVTLVRLDERYADYLQVGFLAYSRHDGLLLDAGTNPVKYLNC